MSSEEELIELEREGWRALSSDRGAAYYRHHLADEALMAFSFGVLTREEALEAIESAPPWESFEINAPRVVRLTDDSAVVVYSVVAQRAGEEPFSGVISSTFARTPAGEWKLAFHHQAPSAGA